MTIVKAGAVVIWGHATSYRVCHDSRLPLQVTEMRIYVMYPLPSTMCFVLLGNKVGVGFHCCF